MQSYGKLSSVSESGFVGREKEFNQITQHLEESIQNHGRLVFVVGEAGIGKSRLISELAVSWYSISNLHHMAWLIFLS